MEKVDEILLIVTCILSDVTFVINVYSFIEYVLKRAFAILWAQLLRAIIV